MPVLSEGPFKLTVSNPAKGKKKPRPRLRKTTKPGFYTKRNYSSASRNRAYSIRKSISEIRSKPNECTVKYALVASSPFSGYCRGACTPSFPSRESQKATVTKSGTFVCSGNASSKGYGFVAATPCLASNLASLYHSDVTTTLERIDISQHAVLANTAISVAAGALPYSAEDLVSGSGTTNANVKGRIVGVGLRVRYIGAADQTSGLVYGFVSPIHGTLEQDSISDFSSRVSCVKKPVGRQWVEIATIGCDTNEIGYPDAAAYNGTGTETVVTCYPYSQKNTVTDATYLGGTPLAIQVQSHSGAEFEYEYIIHAEYVGEKTSGASTRNHTVPGGQESVAAAKDEASSIRTDQATPSASFNQCFAKQDLATAMEVASHQENNGKRSTQSVYPDGRPGYNPWGYNYLGPGNPIDGRKPTNALDALAESHDIRYDNAASYEDVRAADIDFIRRAPGAHPVMGTVAAVAIAGKLAVESVIGPVYPAFN